MNLTGIVLAGGKSSRMGTDKGLLEFNGKRLVEYPLEILASFCTQQLISSNNQEYAVFGIEVIADQWQDCGPVGGLASVLKRSDNEWNLVLGCDLPFLNRDLIELLISKINDQEAIIPISGERMEPMVALYRRSLSARFEEALREGNYALHRILKDSKIQTVDISDLINQYPLLLSNLNTPDDLAGGAL